MSKNPEIMHRAQIREQTHRLLELAEARQEAEPSTFTEAMVMTGGIILSLCDTLDEKDMQIARLKEKYEV